MNKRGIIALLLVLALSLSLMAGCAKTPAPAAPAAEAPAAPAAEAPAAEAPAEAAAAPVDVIKIGIVNPMTGPLAGFGEGCPWTEQLIVDYVNNELGGIAFEAYGDTKLPIEIVVYDSTSDTTTCAEMAQKLIEEDKVNIIIARHTPETVNPVSAVAERYGVPCVCIEAPVDAWAAEGPYEWSCHSFWTLEVMFKQYSDMWKNAGFEPNTGVKVGIAFANDADGTAWHGVFADKIVEAGYELVDPGQFPAGTTDYSDFIAKFKDANVDILCGTNTMPDFAALWLQCNQQGFQPKMVTMGKAYLLESDALAIGAELMDGLCAECWWSPDHPYQSGLTGMTPKELTQMYLDATGQEITQPMGYKYASMELVVAALTNATSLEPEAIRDGIFAIDVDTIVGHIKYDQEMNGSHFGYTPLSGMQWQLQEDGSLDYVIISNVVNPEIPITGEYKPISYE